MRDPLEEAIAGDIGRIHADMSRILGSAAFVEPIHELIARQGNVAELINQQAMLGQHLSSIGQFPAQDLMASYFAPAAHEVVRSFHESALASIPSMIESVAFDRIFEDTLANLGSATLGVGSIVAQMQEMAQATNDVRALMPTYDPGLFMGSLPDLAPLKDLMEEVAADEGTAALRDHDFGFASVQFSRHFLAGVAWIAKPVEAAVITNRLTALTRNEAFREQLEGEMSQSAVLARRWPVVDRALKAHRERDYFLSIPALLPQVEGAMADALKLKDAVSVRKGKLYRKDPRTGKIKPDKNGDPIEIKGGKQLLQGQPFRGHPILEEVAEVLASELVGDKMFDTRNHIMHGRKLNYNKAGLSTRALLVLMTVAPDIAAFEAGKIETDALSVPAKD